MCALSTTGAVQDTVLSCWLAIRPAPASAAHLDMSSTQWQTGWRDADVSDVPLLCSYTVAWRHAEFLLCSPWIRDIIYGSHKQSESQVIVTSCVARNLTLVTHVLISCISNWSKVRRSIVLVMIHLIWPLQRSSQLALLNSNANQLMPNELWLMRLIEGWKEVGPCTCISGTTCEVTCSPVTLQGTRVLRRRGQPPSQ